MLSKCSLKEADARHGFFPKLDHQQSGLEKAKVASGHERVTFRIIQKPIALKTNLGRDFHVSALTLA